jgi:hypothetical protein
LRVSCRSIVARSSARVSSECSGRRSSAAGNPGAG